MSEDMAVYQLFEKLLLFPSPEEAEPDGLLAVGGDLSVERLRLAYSQGIFPWFNQGSPYLWWCPKERFVIFPSEIRISKSMKKFMRKTNWEIRFNTDFAAVIHSCRMLREPTGTWITQEMEDAYIRLHQQGYATSCEVWDGSTLVGGLYGVDDGKCFFGESMFSLKPNASKLALITLARELEKKQYRLIDCQFHTEHLERMGGRTISYEEYETFLTQDQKPCEKEENQ